MEIIIHQTHHTIADFDKIFSYIKDNLAAKPKGIHLFPELFLCGYPLQDLCLQRPFIQAYQDFLQELQIWLNKNIDKKNCCLLMGGLKYELSPAGVPIKIQNVIYQHGDQLEFSDIYTKRLLPNYDIFDEKKYFSKGHKAKYTHIFGKNVGLLICEDMWSSSFYEFDPVEDLYQVTVKEEVQLDVIFNLSASPFVIGKQQKRINRASEISNQFECPFYYVNKVGGEDEILFDGQSFAVNGNKVFTQAKRFQVDLISSTLPEDNSYSAKTKGAQSLTWEELFQAYLVTDKKPAKLIPWDDEQCQEVLEALCFGFQDYARKNGFNKFTIALSGGMDSALVLTLIRLSLKEGQYLEAIYMPSIHSSSLSYDLSLDLCKNLGIPLKSLPIKFLHSTAKNLFGQNFPEAFEGVTDENIQSRLRGLLIYTRSNQINSMVVNTSNKSELAVGYSTQYGDSVGAISLLGDLYKSQVYRLATYINQKYNAVIPEQIISRPPSAELRPDQVDTETLPPYDILDAILEGVLNYRYHKADLLKLGFTKEHIEKTLNLYRRNEYKRYQFCPIIKISSKSFGFGYRIPISKSSEFYQH